MTQLIIIGFDNNTNRILMQILQKKVSQYEYINGLSEEDTETRALTMHAIAKVYNNPKFLLLPGISIKSINESLQYNKLSMDNCDIIEYSDFAELQACALK